MKEEIIRKFAINVCNDLQDIIIVGLNEESEKLPYSTACINFLCELKKCGLNGYMDYFSESFRELIYEESKRYIER